VIPHIKEHISLLMGFFKKYFHENSSQYDWVRDPFNAPTPMASALQRRTSSLT